MVLEIEGLNYIWSITCPTCPCDMFDMFLWYVRHVPLVCSTCSFDMFSMFLQYVQHAHNTCSSCKNYMYLHVLPHVPCSMCMFFSGGPLLDCVKYIYQINIQTPSLILHRSFVLNSIRLLGGAYVGENDEHSSNDDAHWQGHPGYRWSTLLLIKPWI